MKKEFKCDVCGFEAKSEFGLKAHMRKHKDILEKPVEEIVPADSAIEAESSPKKKTIAKLINNEGNVIFVFSLEKNGQEWIDLAVKVSEKKKLKLEFE